ncbi:FAD-dependent oxidoreductase [Acuticoccus sp. M5D2P5]|uniref:dihydrolipoyl dehydrogenase family protein n=1 Tax=Acuticoccus kalidii TaxID=2910977 RepID=UPI001F158119|nr:FAD-dependent oxidoreductase [Acuticoccus kalidii]MCF3932275.1 FAD-dependent oxidoreductase [Acuticoccus kalidii]
MNEIKADICVIGAGSAGLTVAAASASLEQTVVLIEAGKMGGDCLNTGCVPSKSLIAAARHAAAARDGARFGVYAEPRIDFPAVQTRVVDVVASIAPHDSVERFESLGVTVLRERAHFEADGTVVAGPASVRARRTVIATGSRPFIPPIEGLADCAPLTNESVFDLTRLPARLAIIGGGAVGVELGQAFAALGAGVTIIEEGHLLSKEDPEAVAIVRRALQEGGVEIMEETRLLRCSARDGTRTLTLSDGRTIEADEILVATGRRPNIEGLALDAVGVAHDAHGITVDHAMRTTNRRIYAIGDVTGGLQFTHVAGHQASLVVRSIVFRLPVRYAPDTMPRVTYTMPEIAQVGLTAAEAAARDPSATTQTAALCETDRGRTDGATDGFVKLVISGRGRLLGATIVAPTAGDIASTYALALAAKVKLSTLASYVPPYPTLAEAGKRAAVGHFAAKLDALWIRRLLRWLKRL